jgi:hypothetical protein
VTERECQVLRLRFRGLWLCPKYLAAMGQRTVGKRALGVRSRVMIQFASQARHEMVLTAAPPILLQGISDVARNATTRASSRTLRTAKAQLETFVTNAVLAVKAADVHSLCDNVTLHRFVYISARRVCTERK